MSRLSRGDWIGIIGIVLAVIGLGFGYYTWSESRETRDLVIAVLPNRTEIITSNVVQNASLHVLRADGSPVVGDVSSLQFQVWNEGKRPVHGSDVLDSIRVAFADTSVRILDARVLRATRPVVGPVATVVSPTAVGIGFRILEQNDGFAVQVIYAGARSATIRTYGTVEGVSAIRRTGRIDRARAATISLVPVFFTFALLAGLIVFVLATDLVQQRIKPRLPEWLVASAPSIATWAWVVVGVVFIGWLVVYGYSRELYNMRANPFANAPAALSTP